MNWLRLWHEMPNDPKWRTIARVSGRSISEVIAVYIHVLVCASNASERGRTHPNARMFAEDVATSLDLKTADVEAILHAMQGRVLEGTRVSGWETRQPQREDNSADRAREWRERQKANANERTRTQTNANERPEKIREEEIREEKNKRAAVVVSSGVVGTETPKPPSPKTGEGRAPVLAFDRQGVDSPGGERAGSGSSSVFELSKKQYFLTPASLFADWWQLWSKTRGTHHSREALEAWQQYVPPHLESAAIECTASYLDSLDHPAKGYNPHTFLKEQAREGFAPRWPPYIPRQPAQREGPTERSKRVIAERMVRNGRI